MLVRDLIIPSFDLFQFQVEKAYNEVKFDPENYKSGAVAAYIPTLARVDSELFATAFCSNDS